MVAPPGTQSPSRSCSRGLEATCLFRSQYAQSPVASEAVLFSRMAMSWFLTRPWMLLSDFTLCENSPPQLEGNVFPYLSSKFFREGDLKGRHATHRSRSSLEDEPSSRGPSLFSTWSADISSFPLHILMQSVQFTSAEQSNYQVNITQWNAEEPNNQIQVNINCYTFCTWIQKRRGDGRRRNRKGKQISTKH